MMIPVVTKTELTDYVGNPIAAGRLAWVIRSYCAFDDAPSLILCDIEVTDLVTLQRIQSYQVDPADLRPVVFDNCGPPERLPAVMGRLVRA